MANLEGATFIFQLKSSQDIFAFSGRGRQAIAPIKGIKTQYHYFGHIAENQKLKDAVFEVISALEEKNGQGWSLNF